MIRMDTLDLTDFFTTKPQAVDFSARISSVTSKLYDVNFDLEKELQNQLGIKKKDNFMTLLRDNEIPIESKSDLNNFFDKIRQSVSALPVATLTLAIEPTEDILKSAKEWFVLRLKKQVLLDVQINQEIIAGAVISYEGKYHNSSIKPVFQKVFSQSFSKTNAIPAKQEQ